MRKQRLVEDVDEDVSRFAVSISAIDSFSKKVTNNYDLFSNELATGDSTQ